VTVFPAIQIPCRRSIATQVADNLRVRIQKKEWTHYLPGENILTKQYQISRSALRIALSILEKERLILVSQGKRRRIARYKKSWIKNKSKVIQWLLGKPFHRMPSLQLYFIHELQTYLEKDGFSLALLLDPNLHKKTPSTFLKNTILDSKACCWICSGHNAQLHHWFFKKQLHCIILGASSPNSILPSYGLSYEAIIQHAIGMLFKSGHRRIALLQSRQKTPLKDHINQNFFKMLCESAHSKVEPSIVPYGGGSARAAASIALTLRELLNQSHRPTAILTVHSKATLSAISYLSYQQLRIPRDISLISTEYSSDYDSIIPKITCYKFNEESYIKRFAHLLIQFANTGKVSRQRTLVFPKYFEGETLGPAPK
jgi:DNA-binding LacI/PurR family transcriptional regulator